MADFSLKPIIMFFVVVLIGIVFLGEIADNQIANTELSSVTNESIAITMTTNTVTNETITMASGAGTTANSSVRNITFFGNATHSSDASSTVTIVLGTTVNVSKLGQVNANGTFTTGDYNISYTYTTAGTGDTVQDDITSIDFFGNATNSTHLAGVTAGTEINFTKPGVISVDTLSFDPGTYNISYGYEGDLYVVDTKSHIFLKLLGLFFVLVIFAFAIQTMRESSDNFNFGFGKN